MSLKFQVQSLIMNFEPGFCNFKHLAWNSLLIL